MYWPTPQDFNEAIQWPEICFEDPELVQGTPELNPLGVPRAICGNFASVYQLTSAQRSVAVKCFLRNVYNQHQRYAHFSQFMAVNHIGSILDFDYMLKGILIEGNWYPIVKMGWAEGPTLDQFVRKNLHNRQQLDRFLSQFVNVMQELQRVGIAHGDLQHGNIIVRKNDVMLVDYDCVFVPAMKGEESNELGHANFQHPERTSHHFDKELDHFSAWIIYHTIHFLRYDPTLWQRHSGGDDCLLFKKADFEAPNKSRLMSELERHPVPEIKSRAVIARQLLECSYDKIPPFRPGNESERATKVSIDGMAAKRGEERTAATDPSLRTGDFPRLSVALQSNEALPPFWPAASQYVKATAHSPAFNDSVLLAGRVKNEDRVMGKKSVVLKVVCPDKIYAVKCFLSHVPDRRARYEAISKHNMKSAASYLVSFQYQSRGIFVEGHWFPILRMSWVDGVTIDRFVRSLLASSNKHRVLHVLTAFRAMMEALAEAGIAHGDLEPGNILVDGKERLKLVDYDAMYVPALACLQSAEVGEPAYQ
ncbi:MAG TPA: serine/threonine-protein kinase, partial [Candidatus Obscuribacterales bacterium]